MDTIAGVELVVPGAAGARSRRRDLGALGPVALRVALIVALSFSQRAASRYAVLLVYDLDKSSPERLSLTRDAAERAIALGGGAAD